MTQRLRRWGMIALIALSACTAPAAAPRAGSAARTTVEPWPQGSAFFHGDPVWAGGDGAYSVELDARRVLWLFGDSFVDPAADGSRGNGPTFFVRNSVAIQTSTGSVAGHDLSRDRAACYWGPLHDGVPSSFFHDGERAERWIWPLAGVRVPGGPLLLFRMHVRRVEGGFGFEQFAWDAVAIDDTTPEPSAWQPRMVQPPTEGVLLGAGALVQDGFLYAYGSGGAAHVQDVYLARWPLTALGAVPAGSLARPEWFAGGARFAAEAGAQAQVLFRDGQAELSVHFDRTRKRFVELQTRGLLLGDPRTGVAFRSAPQPWGPWSALQPLWTPREAARADASKLVAYAGKAHPEQNGPGLVVSYVVNQPGTERPPDALYYPQLLRVQLP